MYRTFMSVKEKEKIVYWRVVAILRSARPVTIILEKGLSTANVLRYSQRYSSSLAMRAEDQPPACRYIRRALEFFLTTRSGELQLPTLETLLRVREAKR